MNDFKEFDAKIKKSEQVKPFRNIQVFMKIYLLALLVFFVFRIILVLVAVDKISGATFKEVLQAFIMGLRFDIVICGYLLTLPYVVYSINHFVFKSKLINRIIFYMIFGLFTLAFCISAADIPYFVQFFTRFNITALEWIDSPDFVLKMILGEPRYWLFVLPLILLNVFFYKYLQRIVVIDPSVKVGSLSPALMASVFFLFVMFIGIRGRIEKKSPIRIGTAFISDNAFLNHLGLNPIFTFIRSYLDSKKEENKPVTFMETEEAIAHVQQYLGIQNPDVTMPLLRRENMSGVPQYNNIVIVLMEGMSALKMARHGNMEKLTPFLDSLSMEGIYFENGYSAGIHTFNGVFSTIFSIPAIFRKHPMKVSNIPRYGGLATALKKLGYSTIYFTTHDGQFDNIEGFLKGNDFDKIISQKDYPPSQIKTALGVTDDYLFEFAIPELNALYRKGKPFVSVLMTASDHGPYYIPEYFKAHSKEIKNQATEFADYSLRHFIQLASNQTWYDETLFVFVADHGSVIDTDYDISLAYNHVPILFFAPKLIENARTENKMAGQIDIVPSIMGLLNLPYDNSSLGVNLFQEERPYMFFNVDDQYGVIDHEWLLLVKKDGSKALYRYTKRDKKNYAQEFPEIVSLMDKYTTSHLQTAQYLMSR